MRLSVAAFFHSGIFRSPGFRSSALVYAAVATLLVPFPIVGILHVESSAIVAFVSFFASGMAGFNTERSVRRQLLEQEVALVVPWALLTLALLVRPNCGYAEGLLFFLLFPPVTVVLGVSVSAWIRGTKLRRKRLWFLAGGTAVAVITPLYDLGLHPQFFVYNHLFGGVLGPIYDEELVLRPGLVAFRLLTLLWALFFLLAAAHRTVRRRGAILDVSGPGRPEDRGGWGSLTRIRGAWAATALLIGLAYIYSGPLGINTPAWYLQKQLGAVYRTDHFDLYYDPSSVSPDELRLLAAEHEYHYSRLSALTRTRLRDRIRSYLYPNPEVKANLTGARVTNVAPVWLREPQTHVLLSAFRGVFPHELAHVFSRPYGLPVIRASLAAGLVEGWAVALEPPDGAPSPDDLVSVALITRTGL